MIHLKYWKKQWNGKAKIVDVPAERIPNHQQLKKLDTEILAQVGIYNSKSEENEK